MDFYASNEYRVCKWDGRTVVFLQPTLHAIAQKTEIAVLGFDLNIKVFAFASDFRFLQVFAFVRAQACRFEDFLEREVAIDAQTNEPSELERLLVCFGLLCGALELRTRQKPFMSLYERFPNFAFTYGI